MRISTLVYVLFISSLLLILPTMRSSAEIDLLPLSKKSFSMNVQGTAINFESNVGDPIAVSISYYNPDTREITTIQTNFEFEFVVKLDEEPGFNRGNYNFTFESLRIATVTISQSGIPNSSLTLFGSATILAMAVFLRNRLATDLDY